MRQVRDRGEDRVVARGVERAHARAARLPQRARRVATASRIGLRQRRQHDVAVVEQRRERRRGAGVLGAGDRMARARSAAASRRMRARAAATTSCLVLPASVTTRARDRACGAIAANSAGILRDRRREQHDVGVGELARPVGVERDARGRRCRASSAASRLARLRPTPTTVATAPRALAAPARTSRRSARRRRRRACRCGSQLVTRASAVSARAPARARRGSARFSVGQADGDAQPLGQPVVRDRPHDHALLQQRCVDARGVADLHEHEVAVRRHVREAERVEARRRAARMPSRLSARLSST